MKDESRLIFVAKDQKAVREFKISRLKLFTYISIFLVSFTFFGKIGLDLLVDFSHNSRIKTLERTNAVLKDRLLEAKTRIDSINLAIADIIRKDDQLRVVLGLDKLSSDMREVGIGGADFNYDFKDEVSGFEDNIGLGEQLSELAKLEREVALARRSYEELMVTFNSKQDSIQFLPSLKPVLDGFVSSNYGMRRHPILKRVRHHDGMDFSARRGTPVYASADGHVAYVGYAGGYGKVVKINHKYGYETFYGHLDKYVVRKGQEIKRGQKLGEVGSTGLSTSSHLHYEVRFKGKPVNPELYYFDDNILNEMVVQK